MTQRLTNNLKQTIKTGEIKLTPLPLCPTISLHLISENFPKDKLPQEEILAIMDKPAYWAFCWASGQVLAKHLLDHPDICRHKSVLDLGSGSGVVAIAASLSRANRVIACDIDTHALDASVDNAEANGARIETLDNLELLTEKVDLLIAADVLYDRDNLAWLDRLQDYAHEVLIADSRIRDRSVFSAFELVSEVKATTIPDLDELKEFGDVSIYSRRYPTDSNRGIRSIPQDL
jgi:predicted nicotinamide N-methyase